VTGGEIERIPIVMCARPFSMALIARFATFNWRSKRDSERSISESQ